MMKSLAFCRPRKAGSESDEAGTKDDMDQKKKKTALSFHAVLRRSFEECHEDSYSTTQHIHLESAS